MIAVVKAGLLTTVQDAGRHGWRAFGMPQAGAMDRGALATANLLVGNGPWAAALEMTLQGATLRFERPALAALAGADMRATLDGAPLAAASSFLVPSGGVLALGSAAWGCRAYLAVRGGIDVPPVLGSRSTYTRARVGGLDGRALRAGDLLPVGEASGPAPSCRRLALRPPRRGAAVRLRVLPGPHDDRFAREGIETFFRATWRVTNQNDRMGYRLEGPAIRHRDGPDVLTDPLVPGAVQVPGSGAPIVMAVDCQTTGGYAMIGTVIGPDLGRLAQARLGDAVRFARCGRAEALAALRREEAGLESLSAALGSGPH